MLFVDVLFALLVAVLLSMLFLPLAAPYRERAGGSSGALLFFFLVLFFATWAGGVWLTPVGPALWGGYWLPFVLIGLFVALLLAAAAEPTRRDYLRRKTAPVQEAEAETVAVTFFGVLFWILMIGLAVAVIARYLSG